MGRHRQVVGFGSMEGSSAELVCEDSMGALEMASALLTGVGRAPLLGGGIVVVQSCL